MQQIKWQMPIDLNRQYSGSSLLIHYGAPLNTRQNTLIVPVKTGANDGFRIEARDPANGAVKWMQDSDYSLPDRNSNWVPAYGIALTPKNRVYFPGAGGTVLFRDAPDETSGPGGRLAFYGEPNPGASVKINTPITCDRYGNIYFGFIVTVAGAQGLQSGIARIGEDGSGSWISAQTVTADNNMQKVQQNCAPALSNDQKTLYFGVNAGSGAGYLVSVDSRTLAPIAKVRLKDAQYPGNDAILSDSASSSPTIGPDGDVYFGVLDNPFASHNLRGWLLHFDGALTQTKAPGSFGWDDTVSIVPAALVPQYQGSSEYLLLTKYNNYAGWGSGDGQNKIAVLDPHASMADFIAGGVSVMKEVVTILSPTPDNVGGYPDPRREWCINTAVVDPFTKSAIASCEDGKTYRWDFATNSLTEPITLTNGIGEAYTPTLIGTDGTVYAIANGILFAIGAATP